MKKKTRVIVLGGGISGLSLAWYLSQRAETEVLLLEREERVGGFLRTDIEDGFLFEKGPRIFKTSRSEALLGLVEEIGLSSRRLVSGKEVNRRYIWTPQGLECFPTNLAGFLSSPLTRPLLFALFTEWQKPKVPGDESIFDFIGRRFGEKCREQLFDPLIVGIYAGDMKKLSIKSCFSQLKKWEEEFGSITAGFFKRTASSKQTFGLAPASLFSLEGGIETLTKTLKEKLTNSIRSGQKVEAFEFSNEKVRVKTSKECFEADYLFSAIPSYELAKYLKDKSPSAAATLAQIKFQDIATVHMGFKKPVLDVRGFGYLVPSHAKQEILGTVFDSNFFGAKQAETRLSTMLLPLEGDYEGRALRALKNHLHIIDHPDHLSVTESRWAIPQFEVGHEERMNKLQQDLARSLPRLRLVGNYLAGASVSDAIAFSRQAAQEASLRAGAAS